MYNVTFRKFICFVGVRLPYSHFHTLWRFKASSQSPATNRLLEYYGLNQIKGGNQINHRQPQHCAVYKPFISCAWSNIIWGQTEAKQLAAAAAATTDAVIVQRRWCTTSESTREEDRERKGQLGPSCSYFSPPFFCGLPLYFMPFFSLSVNANFCLCRKALCCRS